MHADVASGSWPDLFEAATSAAAALTGLTFVAISINVREVLEGGGVAERALAAVLELLGVAIVSLLALMPQSMLALGVELAIAGAVLSVADILLLMVSTGRRPPGEPSYLGSGLMTTLPGMLAFIVGGVWLSDGSDGGLYWTVAGIVLSLVGGVTNAWVLLIEILR